MEIWNDVLKLDALGRSNLKNKVEYGKIEELTKALETMYGGNNFTLVNKGEGEHVLDPISAMKFFQTSRF